MAPIEWTEEGPQGEETPEIAHDGVRVAVLQSDGSIEEGDRHTFKELGGALPSVGDRIAMLWPVGDHGSDELFRVLARYFIGEFAGDYAWWLLVSREMATERDERIIQIARQASIDTRRARTDRADYFQRLINAQLEANKPKPKPRGGSRTVRGNR